MANLTRRRAGLSARRRAAAGGSPTGPGATGGFRGPLGLNVWQTMVAGAVALALLGIFGLAFLAATLPDPSQIQVHAGEIKVLDRHGRLVEDITAGGEVRQQVPIGHISPLLQAATVAAEDRHFYEHHGIDFGRLLKALTVDVVRRSPSQGASTITEQLAKVELLGGGTGDRSLGRKVKEAILATEIESRFDKPTILDLYLNAIPYGHRAYGIQAASQVYFGKDAKDLDLAQASMLAGLPQAPYYYDLKTNFAAAKAKQRYVLDQLVRDSPVGGVTVTRAQADAAFAVDLKPQLKFREEAATGPAPHFVSYVQQRLEQDYHADQVENGSGLTVTTTLDLDIQNAANQAVQNGLAKLKASGCGCNNAALLVTDERPGERGQILAMVGSADFNDAGIAGQINITTDPRQPGSSFKPYVYLAGLEQKKVDTLTTLDDTPQEAASLNSKVSDYDNVFQGQMTMRTALLESRNVPAEEAMQMAGPDRVVEMAHRVGIGTQLEATLPTAIGASPVTMVDHSEGYGVLATEGHKNDPTVVLKVLNADQQDITLHNGDEQTVVESGPTYILDDVLKGYSDRWALGLDPSMAAKSGTTNVGTRTGDGWLMAYNPDVVVAGWAGKTSSDITQDSATGTCYRSGYCTAFYGVSVGRQIVAPFVRAALTDKRWRESFTRPSDVSQTNCPPGARDENAPGGGELLWSQDTTPPCQPPTPSPSPEASPSPLPSPSPSPLPSPEPSPTRRGILPSPSGSPGILHP